MDEFTRPVILLAFANAVEQPLPKLMEEERGLRQILEQAAAHPLSDGRIGLCEPVILSRATTADILDAFQKYRNRIAIFHYAGHANGYALLLESATGAPALADADGLAGFLAQQTGLELVFLNGCATQDQAQGLLEAGVEVVIATAQEIKDTVARDFALRFYQGLVSNAAILTAFNEAESGITTVYGDGVRHLYTTAAARRKKNPPAGSPWKLFYPTAQPEIVKHWTLGQLVQDPLFGLPSLPDLDLPDEPYRHLDYFRREHAHIFFGRGRQIRALYTAIQDRESDPLLLLYGQSGIGKSSFLAAGLLPRLEGDYQVAYCRRDQSKGLLGVLSEVLTVDAEAPSLAHAWHRLESAQSKPLIIVIDQVEEFYTRPNHDLPQEMTAFLDAVQAIFGERAHRPQGKLILGFRKEWLAEITKLLRERALPFTDLFLERLDRRGIMEAVTGVARVARLQRRYHLTIEAGLPEEIADDLVVDPGSAIATTLQILLTKLWARAKDRSYAQPIFDRILYHALRSKGLLLSDFFDQQMQTLQTLQPEVVASGLALDLLAYHTTEQDTAEERSLADLRAVYHHRTAILPGLVRHCQDLYLLTDSAQNEPGKAASSRLAHDTLAPLVQQRFDTSDRPGQRAWRILENRSAEWQNGSKGAPLDERDLALVEQGVAGMRAWTPPEQKLVQVSRRMRWIRQLTRISVLLLGIVAMVIVINQRNQKVQEQYQRQLINAKAQAVRVLNQLPDDPVASVQWATTVLPSASGQQPYLPEVEFAYTEALQNLWEEQRLQAVSFVQTYAQIARNDNALALGSNTLALITQPDFRLKSLPTAEQGILGVALRNQELLAYTNQQVSLWHKQTLGDWALGANHSFMEEKAKVGCAEWHPTLPQVAICTGNTLALWQPDSQRLTNLHVFTTTIVGDAERRHNRWSPTGQWLVAWDESRQLALWDGQTVHTVLPNLTHQERIWDVAWSPDSHYLVTVSGDRTAKVWQAPELQLTATVSLTWIAQGATQRVLPAGVTFADTDSFMTWGFDNVIRQWRVTGELAQIYVAENSIVSGAALLTDTNAAWLFAFLENGEIQRWDWRDPKGATRPKTLLGHTKRVIAFDRRGDFVATGSLDGTARVWNGVTGEAVATFVGHQAQPNSSRKDVMALFLQDDQHLVTVGKDGTARRWHFTADTNPLCEMSTQPANSLQGTPAYDASESLPSTCYGLSHRVQVSNQTISDARWISETSIVNVDTKGNVVLWAGEQTTTTVLSAVEKQSVWLSPLGKWFVVRPTAGSQVNPPGQIWDVLAGRPIVTNTGPISNVIWLKDGPLLSRLSAPPAIYHLPTGTWITLDVANGIYSAAQLSSTYLATGEASGLISIWSWPNGQLTQQWSSGDKRTIAQLQWLAPDKQLLAATSDGTLTLWDAQSMQSLWQFKPITDTVTMLALSPDAQWLAAAIGQSIFVLNATTGEEQWRYDMPGKVVSGVAWIRRPHWSRFLPQGPVENPLYQYFTGKTADFIDPTLLLVAWGGDGQVHFWHWNSFSEVLRLRANRIAGQAELWPLDIFALNSTLTRAVTVSSPGELSIWQLWLDQPETLFDVRQAREQAGLLPIIQDP